MSAGLTLRRHFRLGIIKVLGPSTAGVLLLFAVYQMAIGAPLTALAGATLAGLAALATWLALHRGDGRMDPLLSLSWLLGSALACHALRHAAVPWLYLVMMSNFFVVTRNVALACNATLIAVLLVVTPSTLGAEHFFSMVSVSLLITALGYMLALRVEGDRVQLEQLASHDSLTGLPNRRMLERSLSQRVADPRRATRRHGLIVLDIDHFKEVNDLYGHAEGDRVLAELATLLRAQVRAPDEVFRFGGEEFVVVARLQSATELSAFARRLHDATRSALRGPNGTITVSLGAAMLCDEVQWHDWFSRADTALYQAKNNGRNRYVIAEDVAQD